MLKHLEISQKCLEKRLILFKITQKYLKEINNIIKESHAIKDNNIIHRKKINDSERTKINNDVSCDKNIYEQFLYLKFKDKLSNELK